MTLSSLQPWEALMKQMVWEQLGEIRHQTILDFGSGSGVTACYYAQHNDVTAVEPSQKAVRERWQEYPYRQMTGSTEVLKSFPDASFDVILCHNVLEYAEDRQEIVREFARLLKKDGLLSIVKHNRAGRVMQMVVLLNDFERAHGLLDGQDDAAARYGCIRYYEDEDIERWCSSLKTEKVLGMRTFWDLQQNQENHQDAQWQEQMLEVEKRVSSIEEYRAIAFFHHLLIRKQ